MEQTFRDFLSKNPAIETCYAEGLINRRALARHIIRKGIANKNQTEAVVAMLRRFQFEKQTKGNNPFGKTRINIKDNIIILDFEKEKELVKELQNLIKQTNYDKGDTLKIVVGSSNVKVLIDESNESKVKGLSDNYKLNNKLRNISELSVIFAESAVDERGILSTVTKQMTLHGIVIAEFLTASPELLIYLDEKYVLKAYEILKDLQNIN